MGDTPKFKIAALDDDPIFLDHLSAFLWLETQIDVVKCATEAALIVAVEDGELDGVLIDYDLGGDNGISVADRLRTHCVNAPPIFLLTGGGNERTAVKAFRSGFANYFSKRDFRPKELLDAITDAVEKRKRDAAIHEQISSLKQKLELDPDTGLHSALFMRNHLIDLVERGGGASFAVILVSLANLPAIRAQLGHQKATHVVHQVATRIRAFIRGADVAGRYDTDTILVLMKGSSSRADLARSCELLSDSVSQVIEIERGKIHVKTAIGAALFPAHGASADDLLQICANGLTSGVAAAALSGPGRISIPDGAVSGPSAAAAGEAQAAVEGDGVAMMTERRKERRQRVLKRAQVIVKDRGFVVDCVVRDLSPHGARLRFDAFFAPPQSFSLHIQGSGETRAGELRWQIGNEIGVELGAIQD